MAISVEVCTASHLGDRAEQQDRAAVFVHPTLPSTMLLALADGMGGHSGGAMAAEQVMIKAKQNFDSFAPRSETPTRLLHDTLNEAHVVIRLTRFTSEKDPHSTAVLLLLRDGRADWVHCGDSRLYRFRDGELLGRSLDHSLVGALQRQGRLTESEALEHPQRNVLLSCLGGEQLPMADFGQDTKLKVGDSFLLCSDGLWAYFSDAELALILQRMSARNAARVLLNKARVRANGTGDNISLVVLRLVEA